jgi:hypothetical protein
MTGECRQPGLDKLSGFSIDEAALLIPAVDDGSNLRGKATLPNHSVVTFALVFIPLSQHAITANITGKRNPQPQIR